MGSAADFIAWTAAAELADSLPPHASRAGRLQAARSRWLGAGLALRLARSAVTEVRTAVAANPACPAGVLTTLAADPQLQTRTAAVENPRCPYTVVAEHQDADPLRHPDCPAERLLSVLAADPQAKLVGTAPVLSHRHVNEQARLAYLLHQPAAAPLLANPTLTPHEARTILAASGKTGYAWRYAANPNADPDWLAETAQGVIDKTGQSRYPNTVVCSIATNPNCPPATLKLIVEAYGHHVPALSNPNCPPSAMADLLDKGMPDPDPWSNAELDRAWIRAIATNPGATPDILARVWTADLGTEVKPNYEVISTHAADEGQARTMLALWPLWTGTVADLLVASHAITAGAA